MDPSMKVIKAIFSRPNLKCSIKCESLLHYTISYDKLPAFKCELVDMSLSISSVRSHKKYIIQIADPNAKLNEFEPELAIIAQDVQLMVNIAEKLESRSIAYTKSSRWRYRRGDDYSGNLPGFCVDNTFDLWLSVFNGDLVVGAHIPGKYHQESIIRHVQYDYLDEVLTMAKTAIKVFDGALVPREIKNG